MAVVPLYAVKHSRSCYS